MANYDNLKKAIKKIIYSNENQEITGNILQQVLLDILSTNSVEGKIFAGIANLNTNPGTPDSNVFYIASTPGFYVNFDNNELVKGEISILYNDANGNWLKENLIENFKPSHTNAYTDDFLAIDDFALDPSIKDLTGVNRQNAIANALNAWLNNVMFENTENEIKKLGRCRLLCDGINLECYNYIISFDNKSGIQTISGPCDLTSDNKIIHTSLTYNQIYRTRENGNWNNWRKASDVIYLSEQELDDLSPDLIDKIIKCMITKAIITDGKHLIGIADFLSDTLAHVLNIRYYTHTLVSFASSYPVMAKLTGKLNHSAHTDIYTYIYQKTYNYNASNTGYDVPDTSKTWSDWKLIGGTAYNNEIETFLANALNKNTEQDTKIKNLEKKTLHTNAYTDDFLAIDDFALDPSIKNLTGANRQNAIANALNAWLNNVMFENTENEIKKLGRCRLLCDGINLECYNYIISFDNKSGIQTISGPCDLTSDNKIIHTSLTYNQIYRTRENGNWNNWRKK